MTSQEKPRIKPTVTECYKAMKGWGWKPRWEKGKKGKRFGFKIGNMSGKNPNKIIEDKK